MKLNLKDILSNPYRDLKANPLIEEKLISLMDSINQTGFWDNVVVRRNSDGNYELAYGHHRLEAAVRAGLTVADFIVKDLTDAMMIQIMDNENRETYGSTPASLIESVKAVVQALAKGTIPAFEIAKDVKLQYLRYAPSYVPGVPDPKLGSRPYTVLDIAMFLGRTRRQGRSQKGFSADVSVFAALNALHLKEIGRFNDSLLITKDSTGAPKPITTNELLKITSDIKRDSERQGKSQGEIRKAEQAVIDQQLRLEAQRKEREKEAEAEYQESLRKEAEALKEKNRAEAKRLQKERKEKAEALKEKNNADVAKKLQLEQCLLEIKKKEEAQKVKDDYAPLRREVEDIVTQLERDPSFTEQCKALSRKKLNPEDRERIRQAAISRGSWYAEMFANMFLPPLSVKVHVEDYRRREESKRRAEESKKEGKKKWAR